MLNEKTIGEVKIKWVLN